MDGLEWKTLWKWMIWGCFPIFGNTQVFWMGPLRIVKQSRSWRHLFLRLKAQRSESPAGLISGGVFRGWTLSEISLYLVVSDIF